ncbi:MAG: tetratricopeptide repeat protein [Methyloligellaceae bacterium]
MTTVISKLPCLSVILIGLTGCAHNQEEARLLKSPAIAQADKMKAMQSARIQTAKQYFKEGKYGSAEQAYRLAIEKDPRNLEAWLGIAAAYDQLKKFDNANRAYMIAVKIKGFTPEILNNLGYHYMLRGHYDKARKALVAANRKQPGNPYIQNNLNLLAKYEQASLDAKKSKDKL